MYPKWNTALTGRPDFELWPGWAIPQLSMVVCKHLCVRTIIIMLIFFLSNDFCITTMTMFQILNISIDAINN